MLGLGFLIAFRNDRARKRSFFVFFLLIMIVSFLENNESFWKRTTHFIFSKTKNDFLMVNDFLMKNDCFKTKIVLKRISLRNLSFMKIDLFFFRTIRLWMLSCICLFFNEINNLNTFWPKYFWPYKCIFSFKRSLTKGRCHLFFLLFKNKTIVFKKGKTIHRWVVQTLQYGWMHIQFIYCINSDLATFCVGGFRGCMDMHYTQAL